MSALMPYVVIPNWNGSDDLPECLDSLQAQTLQSHIIVVDNGSTDNSVQLLENRYPEVEVIKLKKNYGFAGGVNPGIKKAIKDGVSYVALLNNDATVDKNWLKNLMKFLVNNPRTGIATSKIYDGSKKLLDSTGEYYTIWGLPYSRGRGERDNKEFSDNIAIFGASGGASLYRVKMLQEIGIFDEDFFAYYEDVDISFRAQLAGWKVSYTPDAVAYHQIGATSSRLKNFLVYQTLKNLPQLMWKNVPWRLMPRVFPRFVFAYFMIWGSALARGQVWISVKGVTMSIILWPKTLLKRRKIQKNRKVSNFYINSIIVHDLPPGAGRLRTIRSKWWKLIGKKA
jgi:GT2 family glycosyltransferase